MWDGLRRRTGGDGLKSGVKSGVAKLNTGPGHWRVAKWTVAALAVFCLLSYNFV